MTGRGRPKEEKKEGPKVMRKKERRQGDLPCIGAICESEIGQTVQRAFIRITPRTQKYQMLQRMLTPSIIKCPSTLLQSLHRPQGEGIEGRTRWERRWYNARLGGVGQVPQPISPSCAIGTSSPSVDRIHDPHHHQRQHQSQPQPQHQHLRQR